MKLTKIIVLLFVSLNLACGGSKTFSVAPEKATGGDNQRTAANPAPADQRNTGGGGSNEVGTSGVLAQKVTLDQTAGAQTVPVSQNRKIIRNADMNLEADSPETSLQKITAIAESKGGFVVESQQSSSDVKTTQHDIVTMTVRVPADKFNETLDEIRKTANRVIVENIKGEDVTEEFIDIEARLTAQKALEAQFIEIMKRAASVQDALNVQRQLADVRGEIEKIEGRKRFLENQSSLSTIKIRLQTPTAFTANSSGFFYRLAESFSTGLDFALNFILGLVTFIVAILPFAVIIGLPFFLVVRYFWRRSIRPRSFSEVAKEELETE